MKKSKLFLIITTIVTIVFFTNELKAQETEEQAGKLSFGADIVSNYIWRGIDGPTLSFQPAVNYEINNFSIGAWASSDILLFTKEIDFSMSYSLSGFTVTLSDYFFAMNKKYFNFSDSTGHDIEIGLTYENENFPLRIYAGTMIWGDDKKIMYDIDETDIKKSNYSTYFELSYTFKNSLNIFAGATPFTGMYGKDFAVVYTGFTVSKEIKVTDNFSLPIFGTFSVNPQNENYFVIFGINL